MQEEVMDLVRERRDAGCAILLSTHILAEAESIADRVAVLSQGLLMIDMSLDELLERARQALEVTLESPAPADLLEGIPGIAEVTVSGCEVRLIVLGSAAQAITRLAPYGVRRVTTRAHELDEMFQQATARDA
jgi:ABC-2 type transport system ATP-binding protein